MTLSCQHLILKQTLEAQEDGQPSTAKEPGYSDLGSPQGWGGPGAQPRAKHRPSIQEVQRSLSRSFRVRCRMGQACEGHVSFLRRHLPWFLGVFFFFLHFYLLGVGRVCTLPDTANMSKSEDALWESLHRVGSRDGTEVNRLWQASAFTH